MPKPQTEEMVTLLHAYMVAGVDMVSNDHRFTYGDVMSAAVHILVESGMESVQDGRSTREELVRNICSAIEVCVMEFGMRDAPEGVQ